MTDLYLISPPRKSFIKDLNSVLEAGVDWFQYRRPTLPDDQAYEELSQVKSITDTCGIPLVVNDRPDLAQCVEADGVHLGENDIPVESVKETWPSLTIGLTRRPGQSLDRPADYFGVGPIFPTNTKDVPHDPIGWKKLEKLTNQTRKMVFAVGGITKENVADRPANLDGVAVSGSVWESDDPAKEVYELKQILAGSIQSQN